MKSIIVKIIIAVLVIVAATFVIYGFYSDNKALSNEYNELVKERTDLKYENSKLKSELDSLVKGLYKKTTNHDIDKVNRDIKDLDEIFSEAFSWKGIPEARAARKDIIKKFGKNPFTDKFLYDFSTPPSGDDAVKLNCGYKSLDVYPEYTNSSYTYYVFVDYYNYSKNVDKHKSNYRSRNIVIKCKKVGNKFTLTNYWLASGYNTSPDEQYLREE